MLLINSPNPMCSLKFKICCLLLLCVLVEFVEMKHEQSSVEKFEKFTWKIKNFSRLNTNEAVCSEPFVLGGYPWYDILMNEFRHVRIYWICWFKFAYFNLLLFCLRRICLYPRGYKVDNYLSIFLEAVKTANMSKGWSRDVKFKLLVFNQHNTNMSITKGIVHIFVGVLLLFFFSNNYMIWPHEFSRF
jgi:hypothetical protein